MATEEQQTHRRRIQIDPAKRRRLLAVLGGNHVSYCYQCGACVGDCPTTRFFPDFNPREIMLSALLGDLDSLLAPGSVIWKCSNCYNCYERCPQDVRPVEVIIALKNLAREDGAQPDEARAIYETILKTGRSAPVIASLNRKRERMGLPPLPEVDIDELHAVLAPEEPSADRASPEKQAPGGGPTPAPAAPRKGSPDQPSAASENP